MKKRKEIWTLKSVESKVKRAGDIFANSHRWLNQRHSGFERIKTFEGV